MVQHSFDFDLRLRDTLRNVCMWKEYEASVCGVAEKQKSEATVNWEKLRCDSAWEKDCVTSGNVTPGNQPGTPVDESVTALPHELAPRSWDRGDEFGCLFGPVILLDQLDKLTGGRQTVLAQIVQEVSFELT